MTDVERSAGAWADAPDALSVAVSRHRAILDEEITAHGGVRSVEQGQGDGVVAVFSRPADAVAAAVGGQQSLAREPWPGNRVLRVRMALHTGDAQPGDGASSFGATLIGCARIRSLAHGGQVLVSDVMAGLVADVLPQGASLADLGLHRPRDLGRAERVWQLVHRDLERDFPPLASLDGCRHNLPLQTSPLIGRRREIDAVTDVLSRERLVTLTGSGGVGKTRLALAVAAELADEHPGGVWFVDLAGTGGAGSAARATLKALDAPETPEISPAEQVAVELGEGKRSLIVLDNCEHLLDDCARFVGTLLAASPVVSVLATSREPLGVPGEVTWRVPSLPAPPRDEPVEREALWRYESVALFVDRARRARSSFTVTEANAAAVARVCHRLDGIPLAIELAAACCRHLSAEQIAAGLDDRFRLLTGGFRGVVPRHRTLAASVEWSVGLLDDTECRVLRRLGVFAGPFSPEAAEAIVATPGDLDPTVVLDTIGRLVDKSLVVADHSDTAVRYRLLETIRAFAVARALDASELAGLRDAHARWWRDLFEAWGVTGPTDDVVALVDSCYDDIVAALSWAAQRDPDLGLELLTPVALAVPEIGRGGDAMATFEQLLGADNQRDRPRLWLRAAASAVMPLRVFRGPQAYVDLAKRCEAVARELHDPFFLANARWQLAVAASVTAGGCDTATTRELLRRAREHHQPYAATTAMVHLAMDARLDEPERAREALREAEDAAASYGSQYLRSAVVAVAGAQHLVFGDLPRAVRTGFDLIESRSWPMRRHGIRLLLAGGLLTRDHAALQAARDTADHAVARRIGAADPDLEAVDWALGLLHGEVRDCRLATVAEFDPWLSARGAVDRGDPTTATAQADQLTRGPTRQAIAHAITGLVYDDENAWHEALRLASQFGLRLIAADALEGLGVAAAASDSSVEALRLLGAADRLREETGYRWRFAVEQQAHDTALTAARSALGDAADAVWAEGRGLEWHDAAGYARRARGERRRPRHGWASLTPTEQHVVELVAQGLTNPQIGEKLLISRGTVKTHLEHVFTKTGCHTRAELAAEATRQRTKDST